MLWTAPPRARECHRMVHFRRRKSRCSSAMRNDAIGTLLRSLRGYSLSAIGGTTDFAAKTGTPCQFKSGGSNGPKTFNCHCRHNYFCACCARSRPRKGAKSLPEHFASTLSAHDISAFAALFADDYVNHQVSAAAPPPPPDKSPKQATVDFFAARLAGIPDLQVAVEATVASNDMVAASFVYTGTHTGTLFGVAPTGRSLRFTSGEKRTVR